MKKDTLYHIKNTEAFFSGLPEKIVVKLKSEDANYFVCLIVQTNQEIILPKSIEFEELSSGDNIIISLTYF